MISIRERSEVRCGRGRGIGSGFRGGKVQANHVPPGRNRDRKLIVKANAVRGGDDARRAVAFNLGVVDRRRARWARGSADAFRFAFFRGDLARFGEAKHALSVAL
jgi:hypothetical protein